MRYFVLDWSIRWRLTFTTGLLMRFVAKREKWLSPFSWMEDVLSKLPYWQRDGKDLAGLLPRAWAKENQITPK